MKISMFALAAITSKSDVIMPCRWKKQGFSSGEDCVSKMTGKVDDPQAFCYGPVEGLVHPDFLKIYKQFIANIKDDQEAHNRYVAWVTALNLDETKPYGQSMREQFRWVRRHVDFNLWKEDSRAKYWQVDAGFPLESMNMNIYTLEELQESARTLAHKTANINHKFSLPTIDIPAAKFEDGVVECVLRVPKELRCPVCTKGKTINDLIESGGIVNVSLEASCTLKSDDPNKCEGMEFTGLSLLTKDVLPGIPLTRLMPLEHIMVEALQSSTKTQRRRRNVKKIKMEVLEQDEEPEKDEHGCVVGKQKWDAEAEKCVPIPPEEQVEPCPEGQKRNPETDECEPVKPEEQMTQVIPVEVPVKKSYEPDEHGQCNPGDRINALGKCVQFEDCGEGRHWDANANEGQGGCVSDTPPKPEAPETAVGISAAPREDVLTDAPTEVPTPEEQPPITGTDKIPVKPEPAQPAPEAEPLKPLTPSTQPPLQPPEPKKVTAPEPHTCPDGRHWDVDANMCVPDTALTERVRRFKAEDKVQKVKNKIYSQQFQLERLTATWEKRYIDLSTQFEQLLGGMKQQSKRIRDLESSLDKTRMEREDLRVELRQFKGDYADKTRDNKHLESIVNDLKIDHENLKKKYHGGLAANLDLTRKNTKANEDYLAIAIERDELKEKLKKARTMAKRTLKIKY